MREIKFRFWSGSRMFYDLESVMECLKQQMAHDLKLTFPIPYDHVGERGSNFMQYTGLKDKKGKEIYEGDILQWPHLKSSSPVEVYYNDDECVFVGRPLNKNEETESWLDNKCEVIGNIYQNPELVKH